MRAAGDSLDVSRDDIDAFVAAIEGLLPGAAR